MLCGDNCSGAISYSNGRFAVGFGGKRFGSTGCVQQLGLIDRSSLVSGLAGGGTDLINGAVNDLTV